MKHTSKMRTPANNAAALAAQTTTQRHCRANPQSPANGGDSNSRRNDGKRKFSILNFQFSIIFALALTFCTSVFAEDWYAGTKTYTSNTTLQLIYNMYGNVTLDIQSGVTVTLNGSIIFMSGHTLTKTGAGKLLVNGGIVSTVVSGATLAINQGVVEIGGGAGDIQYYCAINIGSNGSLDFNRNNAYSNMCNISGAGKVNKSNNTAKVTLLGNLSYTGTTTIANGTLQIGAGTVGGATFDSPVTLSSASSILRFEPSDIMTFSKVISGPGKVEYKGNTSNKRLFFTGANTHAGTTTIEEGRLTIGNGATGAIAGNIINNGELYFSHSSNHTYSGEISGSGSVRQDGTGKTILTGVNTYSGTTVVDYGTLQIGDGTSGSIANTSNVEIASGKTLRFEPGSNTTFSKVISGNGGKVEYKGNTTNKMLYLTANNTYTGTTTIEAGRLTIGNGATGAIAGNIINNGELYFSHNSNHTYSGEISGSGSVRQDGTGKTILTGVNTYTGKTVITNGTLQIGDGSSGKVANTSNVEIASGKTLRFEPGSFMGFSKVISGNGGKVEYKGTNIKELCLAANNTYTGTTTIEEGIINIGGSGTSGAIAGNIVNNGKLTFNRSNNYTYSGVISGSGIVRQLGSGKTTLTGVNTYTGTTVVDYGTLQIGDGTSGSIANTSNVEIASGKTLRFEPGSTMTFSKVISGNGGKVEYKGTTNKTLQLTANNTYTGTTTIEQGILFIDFGGTSGAIAGNIINNGELWFNRSNEYTYSGVISGSGSVMQFGTGKITLTGVNTYTGTTTSYYGILALGAGGSIENSSEVELTNSGGSVGKLDISAGNKTIKALTGTHANNEVILGSGTLTIGSAGAANGGGTYKGYFTGTGGGVIKKGTGTFIMTNPANTATGLFSLEEGTMEFTGNWAGDFSVAEGVTLDIKEEVAIGGALTLQGGDIFMNLTTTVPSKIIASGAASVSGTNTLHITTEEVTNAVIMQAASGLSSTTPFTLDMPGYYCNLTATGAQLLLTASITDNVPPTPGDGVFGTADVETANLHWTAATDNETPAEQLRYFVYQSSGNNIITPAECETNGTLLNAGGSIDITEYAVTGLTPDQTYWFNVVVVDMANNKAAYTPLPLTTGSAAAVISVTISPKTVTLALGDSQQFTATVVAEGGADETVTWILEGHTSMLTAITADGLLTVGENETATTITVKVVSNFNSEITDNATVTIVEEAIAPVITTPTVLPDGNLNYAYSTQLEATGTPATWSILSGALPAGLTLSETGLISGIPTAVGNFEFKIKAQNSAGSDDKNFILKITDEAIAPVITTSTILPDGNLNYAYSTQLEATGTPATWSLLSGALPAGLTLSETGLISGTPTAVGNFEFKIKAQNAAGSDDKNFILKIIDEVGIDELPITNYELRIYPNPTSGQLTIDNGELTMENIEIYDVMGRTVNNCQLSIVNCQLKINVSHLPSGMYFLKIGNKTAKFIKQ